MADDRLTAERARKMALAAQSSTQRKRIDSLLVDILIRITGAAGKERLSLEYSFLPPTFDLVESARTELAALGYTATLKNLAEETAGYRPHEKVLTIRW